MAKTLQGRPGMEAVMSQLLALALALREEPGYQSLDRDAVASRFGISTEDAAHLFSLLEFFSTVDAEYALLDISPERDFASLGKPSHSCTRLRLTREEADAVAAALEAVGVPGDDPFVANLVAHAGPLDPEAADVPEAPLPGALEVLAALTDALSQDRDVTFDYVHVNSSEPPRRRTVHPVSLRPDDSRLMLEALDRENADAPRTFLVANVSNVRQEAVSRETHAAAEKDNVLTLTFSDPAYYDLFEWNGAELVSGSDRSPVVIRLGWYGNDWLPLRIRACRGTCTTDDPRLARRVEELASLPLPAAPDNLSA